MEIDENDMVYEAMEFINLIKQGKLESDINSHKNSRKVVEIMENLANKNQEESKIFEIFLKAFHNLKEKEEVKFFRKNENNRENKNEEELRYLIKKLEKREIKDFNRDILNESYKINYCKELNEEQLRALTSLEGQYQ